MGNDKEIQIETKEKDVGLDDNIKAGARALGKRLKTPIETLGKNIKQKKLKKE